MEVENNVGQQQNAEPKGRPQDNKFSGNNKSDKKDKQFSEKRLPEKDLEAKKRPSNNQGIDPSEEQHQNQ